LPSGKIIRNRDDFYKREPYQTIINIFDKAGRELSFLELMVLLNKNHNKKHRCEKYYPDIITIERKILSDHDLKNRLASIREKGVSKTNLNYYLQSLIKWFHIIKNPQRTYRTPTLSELSNNRTYAFDYR
jgi:hypothetical protein